MKRVFIAILIIFCVGCTTTTKGYLGETLPDHELAVIYQPKNKMFSATKPAAAIGMVDTVEVGNFSKGYPPLVKVKPGTVKITLNLTWPSLARGIGMTVGGAVGGAIAASEDNAGNVKSFTAHVEKGKTYIVKHERIKGKRDISVQLEEYVIDIEND